MMASRERGRPARTKPGTAWDISPHLDQPGTAPGNRYFFMNMDAQDAQDNQDEGLLRGELTPAMIRCGLADAQDYKPAVS